MSPKRQDSQFELAGMPSEAEIASLIRRFENGEVNQREAQVSLGYVLALPHAVDEERYLFPYSWLARASGVTRKTMANLRDQANDADYLAHRRTIAAISLAAMRMFEQLPQESKNARVAEAGARLKAVIKPTALINEVKVADVPIKNRFFTLGLLFHVYELGDIEAELSQFKAELEMTIRASCVREIDFSTYMGLRQEGRCVVWNIDSSTLFGKELQKDGLQDQQPICGCVFAPVLAVEAIDQTSAFSIFENQIAELKIEDFIAGLSFFDDLYPARSEGPDGKETGIKSWTKIGSVNTAHFGTVYNPGPLSEDILPFDIGHMLSRWQERECGPVDVVGAGQI